MNAILTNAMKQTILDLDLIDTGALYNSIQVSTSFESGSIIIQIQSEEYIKFLLEPYNIVEYFFQQPDVEEEISKLMVPWIEDGIQRIFNNEPNPFTKLNIQMSFNS
jgi:hypothetical protein